MQVQEYTFDTDIVSDLHKDAYGFRPREGFWARWDAATDAERQEEWDWLLAACKRRIEEDEAFERAAIKDFEERIGDFIALGAKDRKTALRWIMEADECNGDWEFLCYKNGLPYGYFKKAV